jgi:hypothetical protein
MKGAYMAKIEVGDLICMYRRKKKGMGIVLEKTDDIIESADADVTFEEVHAELVRMERFYNERTTYKKALREKAKRPELISTCLLYNGHAWASKPKKSFVRIRWFDRPSLYESNQVSVDEEWCPVVWLKKL